MSKETTETIRYFCDVCKKEIVGRDMKKKKTIKEAIECFLLDINLEKWHHFGNKESDVCNPCYESFKKWKKSRKVERNVRNTIRKEFWT